MLRKLRWSIERLDDDDASGDYVATPLTYFAMGIGLVLFVASSVLISYDYSPAWGIAGQVLGGIMFLGFGFFWDVLPRRFVTDKIR